MSRFARKANPHVVTLLQSDEPPLVPDGYSLGSPEEAAICIEQPQRVWDETDGYIEWMFQEFHAWERVKDKRLRDKKRREQKQKGKRKGRG